MIIKTSYTYAQFHAIKYMPLYLFLKGIYYHQSEYIYDLFLV